MKIIERTTVLVLLTAATVSIVLMLIVPRNLFDIKLVYGAF